MRILARGVVVTVMALIGLVPIQASPATAFAGNLNVDPETVNRLTGTTQRYTATVTGTTPLNGLQISYHEGAGAGTITEACQTDGTGACEFPVKSTTEVVRNLRVFVEDGGATVPCTSPSPPPPAPVDCDGNETLAENDMDDTDLVQANFIDGEIDVAPEDKAFAPASDVIFEVTVEEKEPASGQAARALLANVDAEVEDGPNKDKKAGTVDTECDTNETTGKCELKYPAGAGTGVDKIRAWADLNDDPKASPATGDETVGAEVFEADKDEGLNENPDKGAVAEPDITDVFQASISGGQVLILSPKTANRIIGTQSAITTEVASGGVVSSGIKVAGAVISGPNAGQTATCQTAANGQCTLNYTGANVGTDVFRAAVDTDGNGQPNEADATEEFGTAGGTPEADPTDVGQITWSKPGGGPSGGAGGADCQKSRETAQDDEILIGTKGKDKICGYDGDDVLRGLGGNDKLKGGDNNDRLIGGGGNDRLNGQNGKDNARGGKGDDRCKAEDEKTCEEGKGANRPS